MANKDFASEMNGTFELQLIIKMKLGFCSSIIMSIELQKFFQLINNYVDRASKV